MDYNKFDSVKPERWDRKIINVYWLICLIYITGQLLVLLLARRYSPADLSSNYITDHILIPDLLLLTVMLFTEFHFRFIKKFREYLIILSAMLVAFTILLTISPKLKGGQMVLILPILISIFYFNKRVMLITFFTSISVFTVFYSLSPHQRAYISIYDFVLIILMLFGIVIAGIGILEKGTDMIRSLEKLIKSEEKLIIENSIMNKLSKTDALTGLYNHRTFHEYIDIAINQCHSHNLPLQLAIFDIDNFKKVNDTYGHWTGDIVLKTVAEIIQSHATAEDFVARYGGEEFAVIFTGKSIHESFLISEKIRQTIENTPFIQLNVNPVTVSIGLHDYSVAGGKEALFKLADDSLYTAKRSGKNKIVCNQISNISC